MTFSFDTATFFSRVELPAMTPSSCSARIEGSSESFVMADELTEWIHRYGEVAFLPRDILDVFLAICRSGMI